MCIFALLLSISNGSSQTTLLTQNKSAVSKLIQSQKEILSFTENKGQYGKTLDNFEQFGEIKFGFEALGMPILFTSKGLIHLQRKVEKISQKEEELLEKAGVKEEVIEHKKNIIDRTITMEWVGANANVEIIAEEKTSDYHTYGLLTEKAYGYKKIIYKNLYDGIDLVYSFSNNNKIGFEYSLIVQPGADLAKVKMKYGGDVKSIKLNKKGNLIIRSDIDGIEETLPVSYYGTQILLQKNSNINTTYEINNNVLNFNFPQGFDNTKVMVIDPFVTSTSNLTGIQLGKAIDVDFDYAGNVYVAGGGTFSTSMPNASHSHAKYSSAGTLLWTFNGVLSIPSWKADYYYGGWVVDKANGNLFIGQGYAAGGFRVIRLSTTGLYDNYISSGNPAFQESWKMYWVCNNGNPQIICAGGGTTGNTNFAICNPPSTTLLAASNLTGSSVAGQDMTDLVIDPVTNSLYSIYASPLDFNTANKIYKHNQPYSFATTAWSTATGLNIIQELKNRPYLSVGYNDNSSNILGQNATYIFYWDGLNLKAFNKTTGAITGTPLVLAGNTSLMQGGIVADACNNVFIGNKNGTIKVYNFNGSVFDDAAAPDIIIPGYNTTVYDLALDESKKLLYASGDGFVASFDIATYCTTNIYTLNVVSNCAAASATAMVSPAAPAFSTVTYTLYIGATQIATNTTGTFINLLPNTNYTIIATINLACSGVQTNANFILPGPTIVATPTNATCGNSNGEINIVASGTSGPYTYSIDGVTYSTTNPFIGLAAGIYTVFVKDNGGCISKSNVTILNSDGPIFTFTQTNATCGNNAGSITITASGGLAPYLYSTNNGVTYQTNNFFTGLIAGQYNVKVKDANGCVNTSIVDILSSSNILLNAIPASATCGLNNGSITAFASGGTAPLLYSINGNIFQASNIFTNVIPATYIVTVKDALGCIKTFSATVANNPSPIVTAVSTAAACGNINGTISATGTGGVAPLQYSLNGGTFQTSNIFLGLPAGTYTITVKDAAGCTSTVSLSVASTNGPIVTATTVSSNCGANNGSITATASGTTGPYTYSTNGLPYQASGTFAGLAAGSYVVLAKDNAGCLGAVIAIVSNVAGPTLTTVPTASSCNVNDGTITATALGGTGPYLYSIDGISFGASNVFSGLAPNTYTITVKDFNNCTKTATAVVLDASGLVLSVATVSTSCSNNGIITAIASGGTAPLQYSINGTVYQPGNVFNGLAPATYTVYVKDANGCIITKQAIVSSASLLSLSATNTVQASCGGANGVIIALASGGVAPLTYSINGTVYQNSGTFLNVIAGTYTVYVKDASGCIVTQILVIPNINAGANLTDLTFNIENALLCDGALGKIKNLKGIPNGGGNTYTFSLDFGAFQTGNQFTNVSIGIHYVTAMNQFGCTMTKQLTITSTTGATASAVITGTSCGTSNGQIVLTGVANGGNGSPYHYSLDGGATWTTFTTTVTLTGLAAGSYTIIIADDSGFDPLAPNCSTTLTFIVPSIGGPSLSTTIVNGTCLVPEGSIDIVGNGGVPPYQFSIDGGSTYQPTGFFDNLSAGTYLATILDDAGCETSTSVTITSASGPTVTGIASPTSCGLDNGTIVATAGTGGTAPYEFSINGTIFQPSNTFNNLVAGSYTIYIKDFNGCYSTTPITISKTALPRVTSAAIAASCNNNDGGIIATGSFGTAPYQFSLDGIVYQSSTIFTGLAAGFYTVYVKDDRACITTAGIVIGNIGAPSFTSTIANAKCGNSNGSITNTALGGTAPYTYSIDGFTFVSNHIFSNLLPGNYNISVKDFNGCITTHTVLVGNAVGPHTLTATFSNPSCGLANGSIFSSALGGTAPFTFSIDGVTFVSGSTFSSLNSGSYTITVKDNNGCLKTLPITLINLDGPTLTTNTTTTTCGTNNGTITASALGGTQPLTYSINSTTVYQANNIFSGLAAGTYTIRVKDAKGCITVSIITVTAIAPSIIPTFNAVAAICSGTALSPLPTTSLNGIIGTWAPALDNTTTTIYTFTPSIGQCATTTTLTITVTGATSGIWTGAIDTDWFKAGNWTCGGVPTSTTNVLIPNGLTNYPIIPVGNALCNNMNIQNGASVVVNNIGVFNLYGAITNVGIFDLLDGTLNVTGQFGQVLAGSSILNNTIKNIVISNATSLSDALSVTGNVSFGGSNRIFTTNDNLTLVSNAVGTASYNDITNNGTTSGNITTGLVSIERYLFGQKSWRFLATPVKIATSPTIATSWREGNNSLSSTGFGTQITGPTGPAIAAFGGELDYYTPRGSMKYFNPNNSFIEIANTTNSKIANNEGYMIFVRGDRAAPNTTTGSGTPTTLRIKGEIRTDDQLFNVPTNSFLSVGNPYPSAIDFRNVDKTNISNSFYAWNPILPGAFGVGGYESYIYDGTHYAKVPGGNIRDSIQSGEAFFIQSITGGSITIKETSKTKDSYLTSRANSQSRAGIVLPTLEINLITKNFNGNTLLVDGVRVDFDNGYSNAVDNEDVRKISNTSDNLAIKKDNNKLVVERHATLQATDTIFLNIANTSITQYYFEIDPSVLSNTGLEAVLKDKFLQTEKEISFTNLTTIPFNITADAASKVADRFMIVFKKKTTLINDTLVKKEKIYLFPNPTQSKNINVKFKEKIGKCVILLESIDGKLISTKKTIVANNDQVENLNFQTKLPTGNYNVIIKFEDGTKAILPLIIL